MMKHRFAVGCMLMGIAACHARWESKPPLEGNDPVATSSADAGAPAPAAAVAPAPTPIPVATADASAVAAPEQVASDPASQIESVRLFILDVDQALKKKDAAALGKLARFPMQVGYFEYEMEAKVKKTKFADAATALKKHELWEMKREFIAGAKKHAPHQGATCHGRDTVAWDKGPAAIVIKGETATVTAETEDCGAANHEQIWHLERAGGSWVLVGLDVNYGG